MRFGGKGLPEGTHTFYYTTEAEPKFVDHVVAGHEVDFDRVVKAQDYIDRGLATLVSDAPETTPKKK